MTIPGVVVPAQHMEPLDTTQVGRLIALADLMRIADRVPGDIAEFGIGSGRSFFWLLQMVQLFQPWGGKTVHGFEWFVGDKPGHVEALAEALEVTQLAGYARLHVGDVADSLPVLLRDEPWTVFSLLHIDLTRAEPTAVVLEHALPRLERGGVLVVNAYGRTTKDKWAGETMAMLEADLGLRMRRFPWTRTPAAYWVKP